MVGAFSIGESMAQRQKFRDKYNNLGLRVCTRCLTHKEIHCFSNNRSTPDGLSIYCRTCEALRRHQYAESASKCTMTWRKNNPDAVKAMYQRWYNKLKQEVLSHYGGHCICCGEAEPKFLTLDHINGRHTKHGKGQQGTGLWHWARKNEFPDSLQLLCFNCNCAKGFYGECPHQDNQT